MARSGETTAHQRSHGALKIYANGIGMLRNMSLFPRIWEVNESIPHTEKIAFLEKHMKNSGCFERAD
jgi:hypothetical protein